MGDNEWVRLTPGKHASQGWGIYDYRCNSDSIFDHTLRWMNPPHQFEVFTYLVDAELDALAAHSPAVAALVEALASLRRFLQDEDRVRVQSRCLTADLEFDMIARKVDTALAALGADDA